MALIEELASIGSFSRLQVFTANINGPTGPMTHTGPPNGDRLGA
jgi:hypothetical protein